MTNLGGIKAVTKLLFDSIKIKPMMAGIVQHPFTNSIFVPCEKTDDNPVGLESICDNKEAYQRWRKGCFSRIDRATSALQIYLMVNTAWTLTMLKYWKEYLDKDEFAELFASAWVDSENPNGDANCSIKELIGWFKECNKEALMDKSDYEVYKSLPEEFEVYRGVSIGRNPKGLSWTRDIKKAHWFAHRFDIDDEVGYIQMATIKKENCLAYFNRRNEDEVVVDSIKIKKLIKKM